MMTRYIRTSPMLASWVDPFRAQGSITQLMNDLFRDFETAWSPQTTAQHAVQFKETHDAFLLTADLPGYRAEDVKIAVEDGLLRVEAKRVRPNADGFSARRLERSFGTIRWAFPLVSAVLADEAVASLSNGRLELKVPKAPEAKPRTIVVKTK